MPDLLERLSAALADRYTIESEIGRGGMAVVFKAEDLRHHRLVAIKALHPELTATLGAKRFPHEIETVAGLNHPHVLPLFDSGEADGIIFYVMPYVEGESLRERLDRERQLAVDESVRIAVEVADGLDYAHRHGVVHRDIKPGNILLSEGHAVIADFGIARILEAAETDRMTQTGLAVGTPLYSSPEQATDQETLDGRADIYSLGCVLYEMLGGEPPYTGSTAQAVMAKKLSEDTPRVSVLRETVPDAVDEVVRKALAKAPADRFTTAAQFGEALSPEQVRGPARLDRVRRKPLVPTLISIGVVAVVAILALVVWPRGSQPAGPPRLVVLPFENLGAPEDEYFADGMTDAITARIANMTGLQVISRTSAVLYKNTTKTPAEIGNELRVGYILDGTVQRERPGDPVSRVRITPQLIDVSANAHLWAHPFDEDITEVFRVQSAIAEQVASALEVTVLGIEREAMTARPTADTEAYDAYLRGLAHFRHLTRQSQDSAMAYLELAVELDPDFALAHAVLARVYEEQGATFEGSEVWLHQALEASERALALDSTLAEGYAARGDVLWSSLFGFLHVESARDLKRAIALNPNLSDTHDDLAVIYSHVGLLDEALEETLIAQSLDPLSVYALFRRGLILLWSGDFDRAFAALEPLPVWASPYAAEALLRLGRTDEAVRLIEAAGWASFAHAHHIEYNVGVAYAVLGSHQDAVEWLHRAATNGFPCLPYFERDDFLQELRSDPDFLDLLDWLRAEEDRLREAI
jgi:serine/threonine-protein kinase